MNKLHTVIIALLAIFLPLAGFPQNFNSKVAVDVSAGYIFPTHKFLRGTNSSETPIQATMSAHIKYGFQFGDNTRLGKEYPYTYQGVGLSYNTFFNEEELGTPSALYIFQHARIISLSPSLSIDYEWNFGFSWGWSPYNETHNPYNEVIGSRVNAYINLGAMFNWNFAKQWNLTAGAELTHFSNGNTSYPNYGLNSIGFRASVIRSFGNDAATSYPSSEPTSEYTSKESKKDFAKKISYDIVLYGAWQKKCVTFEHNKYTLPGHFGTIGLNFNPLYSFNRFFKAGVSLDAQYDSGTNIQEHVINANPDTKEVIFSNPPFGEQIIAGLSLRGEVIMPIFSVNVGIGHNLYAKGEEMDTFYQILALKTSITKQLFLHIGCQFYDFDEPHNLMLGFGYRF